MQLTENKEGAVIVLEPLGPIIAGELEELDDRLAQLSRTWTKRIVLNFHDVPFIDSAGLEMLTRCRRELDNRGLNLKLSGLNETVSLILDLTRLSGRFETFPDTAAAVRSFL